MDAPTSTEPAETPSTQERARRYEAAHNRLFLVRIALTVSALAVYQFTGASAQLAEGLRSRFGPAWILVNALYTMITAFGFEAVMFPVSLYGDWVLEHRYGLSKQGLDGWFMDYLKALVIEILLATAFFGVVYGFLRYAPQLWWAWATAFYVLFAVVLTAIAPVAIMPLFHTFEPLDNPALAEAVRGFAEKAGVRVIGVFRWGLDEKTNAANAALTGLGRTRRIILGDTMLSRYTQDEILAVLAHEIGHDKHRDLARHIVTGSVLAAAGFYAAHLVLRALVARFGFVGPADIGAFPLFVFCLFVFSLVTMPLANAYSRRREFAADAYAVRAVGSASAFVTALEKLAEQNLADKDPPLWIELILHSHPSMSRRIRRACALERSGADRRPA